MDGQTRENLIAAGCDEKFLHEFEACLSDKKKCDRLLAKHRRELLDRVHEEERKISCLDYLIYNLEKQRSKAS